MQLQVDTSLEVLDSMLANYLEHCYLEGEDLSFCELCSGFSSVSSAQGQGGSLTLGTTVNAGVAKIVPTESAIVPIPYEVVCLLSMQAYKEHKLEICGGAATDVFVVPEGQARPSPCGSKTLCSQSSEPAKHTSTSQYCCTPRKRGFRPWDEMLSIDLKHMKFLGPALEQILDLKNRAGADKAFTISLEDVNQFMESNWEPLGLKPLGKPHAYSLRHGGASYEAALKLRTLASIQSRGRWQTLKSVKNYEKGSRLAQLFGSLSKATRDKAVRAKKDVVQVLSGKL